MNNFHVGQKVICIDDSPARHQSLIRLRRGSIYTVEGIDPETGEGLYLAETPDSHVPPPWKYPRGWDYRRFRPAVARETDISVFTRMLKTQREPVES